MPSLPTLRANSAAPGSMCGRLVRRSAIVSMSKKTAPGMCACANSARAWRLRWGLAQDARAAGGGGNATWGWGGASGGVSAGAQSRAGPPRRQVLQAERLDVVQDDLGVEIRCSVDLAHDPARVDQEHFENVRQWPGGPAVRVELDTHVLTETVEQRDERPRELGGEEGPLHAVLGHLRRIVAHHRRRVAAGIEAERDQAHARAEVGLFRHP